MPSYPAAPSTPLNHCALSPWAIGSLEFQDNPQQLDLGDVRITDRRLWKHLESMNDAEKRAEYFHDYVTVKFRLHEWAEHLNSARTSLRRCSYARFIQNWGTDSNGQAGAALKAWVESRFGLRATFHHGLLESDASARERYAADRIRGAAQTIALPMQLDLLYTFCQDELRRQHPGERWLTLYRGTHDPEEYKLRKTTDANDACVVLNNLSSFTADREVAWEFGSSVWEVKVPLPKIVFFSGLIPKNLLQGESEFLVLGGDYKVRALRY